MKSLNLHELIIALNSVTCNKIIQSQVRSLDISDITDLAQVVLCYTLECLFIKVEKTFCMFFFQRTNDSFMLWRKCSITLYGTNFFASLELIFIEIKSVSSFIMFSTITIPLGRTLRLNGMNFFTVVVFSTQLRFTNVFLHPFICKHFDLTIKGVFINFMV